MSTRANIIIKDDYSKLYFYRHSDGYPDGTRPTLEKFLELVKQGKIRDNVSQASGWLIIIGAMEYHHRQNILLSQDIQNLTPNDWKVGAYEPTTQIHGDIEWCYIIDLKQKEIYQYEAHEIPKEFE